MAALPHYMLFDQGVWGHHAQYIRQVAEFWVEEHAGGLLDIVVSPEFAAQHTRFVEWVGSHADAVRIHMFDRPLRTANAQGTLPLIRHDFEVGATAARFIDRLRPQHVVFMHLDHVLFATGLRLRFPFPVQLSGILFRPPSTIRKLEGSGGLKARLQQLRKELQLQVAFRNPHFRRLLCLDPYVTPQLQARFPGIEVAYLPDGIDVDRSMAPGRDMREHFGVEAGRFMLTIFGLLDLRKGIEQVAAALERLPEGLQSRLALVMAGHVEESARSRVYSIVSELSHTQVQVILEDRFLGEPEIHPLLQSADLLLLAYQQHGGSSGVLIRAAAAGTPVLGPREGLMGMHIRQHRLGVSLDTSDPSAIADALAAILTHGMAEEFDLQSAAAFAGAHTARQFAATILQDLEGRFTH